MPPVSPLLRRALAGAFVLACAAAAPPARAEEYVIQILTPQSGEWAGMGKAMRNGVSLALEQAEDQGRFRSGVRLSLKDADDNAPAAALAQRMQKQVFDNDAILVIGPMFSTQAETVAATANRYSFPLLSPAVSDGVTAMGAWSFRSGASPHRLIQSMTRTILNSTRSRKIAIVRAEGNAGYESQARTVSSIATQSGRLIVAEVAMHDSEDGYADAAAALVSVAPDLIFVMMDAEPAGVLAARLRRSGLSGQSRLAFAPPAARPELIQVGREYVEDALVAADYLPELPGEQNRAFVASYRERFGATPDRWAGLGFTTGLIAAEAIRLAGPAPSRPLVRDALERVTNLAVPLGQQKWSMGERHEPYYEPALFIIQGGKFKPYTGR